MKTFVAVMNIPSPYRLHLLGELARQLESCGVSFHCHFMAKGHKERPKSWINPKIEFPHTYWSDWGHDQLHFNPWLILRMLFRKCDWMICGSSFDTFTGIAVQLFGRAKVKMAWLEGNTKTPGQLRGVKGWIKRLVLGRCQYAVVPGKEGAGYVALHQALTTKPMPQPVILPNLVDETRFCDEMLGGEDRIVIRQELFGDASSKICLIPARFDPVKGLKNFFAVVTPEMVKGWKLVVMGHGPEEQETLELIEARGLSASVKVIHSVPYDEMPKYYAASDLMLLPSLQDMNPLCVVEALHSGLPLALSERVGNVAEAVDEGRNGWVLHVMDRPLLEQELKTVFATDKERLSKMGRVSKEVKSRFWSTKESVANFIKGILK